MAAAKSRKGAAEEERHVEDHVYTWLQKNGRLVVQAGIGMLAVVVIAGIIVAANRAREREARAEEAAAYAPLNEAMTMSTSTGMTGETDPEALAERRAAFEAVIAEHPDSQAAIDARAQLAALEFTAGNYDTALEGFRSFVADYPNQEPLTSLARLGEGDCLLAMDKLEDALKVYETAANAVAQSANPPAADRARLKAAVVAAMLGREELAREHLNQVILSDSQFVKQTAQMLLDRLDIVPVEQWQRLAADLPEPEPEADEEG